jgi:hypothetical protein
MSENNDRPMPASERETVELDEKDKRILELEHMVMLQTNTIAAFQNRTFTLEMQIVELMSQINVNDRTHEPAPPA